MTFDACSICRTVDIYVIWHIGFKLYARKSVDAFRFVCVVLYGCLILFFFSFSITCWWNKVVQKKTHGFSAHYVGPYGAPLPLEPRAAIAADCMIKTMQTWRELAVVWKQLCLVVLGRDDAAQRHQADVQRQQHRCQLLTWSPARDDVASPTRSVWPSPRRHHHCRTTVARRLSRSNSARACVRWSAAAAWLLSVREQLAVDSTRAVLPASNLPRHPANVSVLQRRNTVR